MTKLTLLISPTSLVPLTHVSQGLTPTPIVKKREWPTVNGTLVGYWIEFRLLSEFIKFFVIGVAF